MNKLYPFSTQKHAHDIEFRRNRVFNILSEVESGEVQMSNDDYDKLRTEHEALTELLEAVLNSMDGRVCYLTGKQLALAKECVAWARNARADTLIANGKPEYLKYC